MDPDTPARYAHNDYFQALAETGVVLQEITDFSLYISYAAMLLAIIIRIELPAETPGIAGEVKTGDKQQA
jgi:hypothetical protein